MHRFAWLVGGCVGLLGAWACGDTVRGDGDCSVGSRHCMCTGGGGCDPGLSCIDGICVDADGSEGPVTDTDGDPTVSTTVGSSATQGTQTSADSGAETASSGGSTAGADDGPLLDVGDVTPTSGCTKMDMLFVLDSSGSMAPERQALAATNAFGQIIDVIESINGGGVDYRIGVSDDKDGGFEVPIGWVGANPWFDSDELEPEQMATSFNGAVAAIAGEPPTGCEHVLTSGVDLLLGDATGFVRDDALLVLVLLTDVDDYGAYDQPDGNSCGFGCGTTPVYAPEDAENALRTTVKGGLDGSVAAIVIAGDPASPAMPALCDQPGVCGCDGVSCEVYWGTKLYAFAELLGTNGYTADLCTADVPMSVQTALTESIDLACMNFEPEG
ncbi:MAG: VWA domain-containing protein [Deltaproteobacteria bacterium]|nr:VWA domain-containing protein [Nannocystaceae bacterium]